MLSFVRNLPSHFKKLDSMKAGMLPWDVVALEGLDLCHWVTFPEKQASRGEIVTLSLPWNRTWDLPGFFRVWIWSFVSRFCFGRDFLFPAQPTAWNFLFPCLSRQRGTLHGLIRPLVAIWALATLAVSTRCLLIKDTPLKAKNWNINCNSICVFRILANKCQNE